MQVCRVNDRPGLMHARFATQESSRVAQLAGRDHVTSSYQSRSVMKARSRKLIVLPGDPATTFKVGLFQDDLTLCNSKFVHNFLL